MLDNCEHVLDGVASLVEFVLAECDQSSVLATSRSALRVADETACIVSPLPTDSGGPAIELFIDRAGVAGGKLPIDDEVLAEIGAVTTLLDGVPLAIELAAARTTAFSGRRDTDLVAERDLAGLGDVRRRGPDRHRTLRAAIEWSMRMLGEDERRLLCRLAMLPGSFRLSTAVAVTDAGEEHSLVAGLQALVEQSLVTAEHRNGPTRYRLLEMVRSVAQGTLDVSERRAVLDRLLDHCLEQLKELDSPVAPAAGDEEEIRRDNALYRISIEHALATDQIGPGLRLVHDLFLAWPRRAQRSVLDRSMTALVARSDAPSTIRAMVLRRHALIAGADFGDAERAVALLDGAESDAIALDDRSLLGRIRSNRAAHDLDQGRLEGLEPRFHEAIRLLEESGDPYVSVTLINLADLHARQGRFDQVEDLLDRAEAVDLPWFVRVNVALTRALCALTAGRIESASEHAATALDLAETTSDPDVIDRAVGVSAMAALARGEVSVASEMCRRMLALAREHDLGTLTQALAALATVSVVRGDISLARACRDELRSRQPGAGPCELASVRLACSFVDLADGDADGAAQEASTLLADAERDGDPYAHMLSLELLAASVAARDPQRAWQLLTAADHERTAAGARAWPLQPYRDAALRTLDTVGAGVPTGPTSAPSPGASPVATHLT